MSSTRDQAWALFDHIVDVAPLRDVNPWRSVKAGTGFEPDYGTLQLLLGVPLHLHATSQSGVPALALDVWVSYELRRAGFDSDWVWPRPMAPRVLPREVLQDLLAKLGREDDAYDAVGLVIPEVPRDASGVDDDADPAGPLEPGATVEPSVGTGIEADPTPEQLPRVTLRREDVPAELDPGRFFRVMCTTVLDRTPINFHPRARALRDAV